MKYKTIIFVFFIAIVFSFCGTLTDDSKKRYCLSFDELSDILDSFDIYENSDLNIHLYYESYLNDSCVIVKFVQNSFKPDATTKILETMKFKKMNLFIHSTGGDSAFYVPDSFLGMVLVRRDQGTNIFYKLEYLQKFDNNVQLELDSLIF